jgi:hypothetical protein
MRTHGEALVTKADLRWTLPEAKQEPAALPDYRFLMATLGLPAAVG